MGSFSKWSCQKGCTLRIGKKVAVKVVSTGPRVVTLHVTAPALGFEMRYLAPQHREQAAEQPEPGPPVTMAAELDRGQSLYVGPQIVVRCVGADRRGVLLAVVAGAATVAGSAKAEDVTPVAAGKKKPRAGRRPDDNYARRVIEEHRRQQDQACGK